MAFPPAGSGTRTSCAEDLPEEGPRQIASAQAAGESAKRIQRSYRAGLLRHPEVYDNKDVMILPLSYRKDVAHHEELARGHGAEDLHDDVAVVGQALDEVLHAQPHLAALLAMPAGRVALLEEPGAFL